jgi:PDZ domain-containing protein
MGIFRGRGRIERRVRSRAWLGLSIAVLLCVFSPATPPSALAAPPAEGDFDHAPCSERPTTRFVAKQGATASVGAAYSAHRVPLSLNAKLRGCRINPALFRISSPRLAGGQVAYVSAADLSAQPTTTGRDFERLAASNAAVCPTVPLPPSAELARTPERFVGRCVSLRVPVRAMERFVPRADGSGLQIPANLDGGHVLFDAPLEALAEDAERGWREDEVFQLFGRISLPQPGEGKGAPSLPVVEVLAVYDGYRAIGKEPVQATPRPLLVARAFESDPHVGIAFEDIPEPEMANLGVDSTRGAVIQEVDPQSRAELAGLRPGDVVVECGGKPIESAEDLGQVVDAVAQKPEFKLKVIRNGKRVTLSVRRRPIPLHSGEAVPPAANPAADAQP